MANGTKHFNLRPAKPEYRVLLSIDGGGVKGVIPAVVLAGFERAAKEVIRETHEEWKHLSDAEMSVDLTECFDTISGNSVGSILALYFASGGGNPELYEKGGLLAGKQPGSAEASFAMFDKLAPTIFRKRGLACIPFLSRLGGLFGAKYGKAGLESAAKTIFGDLRFQDLRTSAYVPAFELNNARPVAFFAQKAATSHAESKTSVTAGYSFPELETVRPKKTGRRSVSPGKREVVPSRFHTAPMNLPIRVAAQASSSAPTFFHPTSLDQKAEGVHLAVKENEVEWVDGAMVSNNPTLQALGFMSFAYAQENGEVLGKKKMAVLSIGTGSVKPSIRTGGKSGLFSWGADIVSVLMESHSEVNHAIVDALFDDSVIDAPEAEFDRYVRINIVVDEDDEGAKPLSGIDAVHHIPELRKVGERMAKENFETMKNFIKNIIMKPQAESEAADSFVH